MTLKLTLFSQEKEDFVREILIDSDARFSELHKLILEDCNYEEHPEAVLPHLRQRVAREATHQSFGHRGRALRRGHQPDVADTHRRLPRGRRSAPGLHLRPRGQTLLPDGAHGERLRQKGEEGHREPTPRTAASQAISSRGGRASPPAKQTRSLRGNRRGLSMATRASRRKNSTWKATR